MIVIAVGSSTSTLALASVLHVGPPTTRVMRTPFLDRLTGDTWNEYFLPVLFDEILR